MKVKRKMKERLPILASSISTWKSWQCLANLLSTEPLASSSSMVYIVQFLDSAGALEKQEDFTGK